MVFFLFDCMRIMLSFLQILYLPHIILFLFSSEKEKIIADIYTPKPPVKNTFRILYDLSYMLCQKKVFRTLFYFRTKGFFANFLRIFYPKDPYFIIDVHTKIGAGLRLVHPYSTILNAEYIGDNCYVNHLVTVGEKHGKKPIIGKNVELHAGCMVIGGVTVGDNAIIGAGAVVVKDVPENAVVAGNPAKILRMHV